ncbi:MAG TPA: fructose-6-phosphate aldolase [bacterium]|nr:fructose-6-phosphate aldolase [bacterium]
MKFFVDTADINEVKEAKELGLADGVTTNPTLIRKTGRDFKTVISEIADLVDGPVNAEVVSTETDAIIAEGKELASWAPNVTVKIPVTGKGLKAVKILESEGIRTTVTLIFSATQALLAAKAGASFICPFVGRLDDIASSGMDLIAEIMDLLSNYPGLHTELIVASIRTPGHVLESALLGAHGVTVPLSVIQKLAHHPLTDSGIECFLNDWKKVQSDSRK